MLKSRFSLKAFAFIKAIESDYGLTK